MWRDECTIEVIHIRNVMCVRESKTRQLLKWLKFVSRHGCILFTSET